MNDKFAELSLREKPMLETLLVRDKNNSLKLLSKFRKIKEIINRHKK